ncbi:MAG TPA: DUF6183 family protein [Actinomycetota bacterium]|nr:DUF6183 family protein [Actinomycetota bacterium]
MSDQTSELIEAGDLNGLLRAVDGLVASKAWNEMLELADRCDDAIERGKQMWPIIAHIDYRIALEAPGEYAAGVLESELSRFLLGPLTEVAASTHSWTELAPHLTVPQTAAYVAQERVLRGEDLTGDERAHPEVLELPLGLREWEPTYALATYRSDHVEVAEPWDPRAPLRDAEVRPAPVTDDRDVETALLDLVAPWTAESNGAARAVVVEGDAVGAASMLAFTSLRVGELERPEAIQRMAWGAASGGAHGRRRGAAYGRFAAWYTTALLSGYEWPAHPGQLEEDHLHWYRWDEGASEEGWVLRIAVEDRVDGWAAALAATDLIEDVD